MRLELALAAMLPVAAPQKPAPADPPTAKHVRQYNRAYGAVARRFGTRAPGRNLLRWGTADGHVATDRDVRASLRVLSRFLAPVVTRPVATPAAGTVSVTTAASPAGGLAACIIQHESGGNPQATNGQYSGIGQWSPSAWAQDGGTRYASSPLGASYSQQVSVLNGEGAAGMQQQQGQFDGC